MTATADRLINPASRKTHHLALEGKISRKKPDLTISNKSEKVMTSELKMLSTHLRRKITWG